MTGGGKDGNSDVNGIGIDGPNVGKLANDIDEVVIDGSGDRGPGRTNCWSIRSRGFRCPVVIKNDLVPNSGRQTLSKLPDVTPRVLTQTKCRQDGSYYGEYG